LTLAIKHVHNLPCFSFERHDFTYTSKAALLVYVKSSVRVRAIKCVIKSVSLSYVSTLPDDITQKLKHDTDELKHRIFGPYSSQHHQQSHWPVAIMAACVHKDKGTSLWTPTV